MNPGQYALHISSQTGAGEVKKFPLANEATYYFHPVWSPDSKLIAFHDDKMEIWLLDTVTGKAAVIDKSVVDDGDDDAAWSPDSKWLAYTQIGLRTGSMRCSFTPWIREEHGDHRWHERCSFSGV